MALQLLDSCGDHYATADIPQKWFSNTGFTVDASGRNGNCIKSGTSNTIYTLWTNLPANCATVIWGFAFFPDSFASVGFPASGGINEFSLMDAATKQISLAFDTAGAIRVLRGSFTGTLLGTSPSNSLVAGAWNFIEVKVLFATGATGTVTVKVNGVTVLTLSSVITCVSANAYANQIQFRFTASINVGTMKFDDLYVFNALGGINNDFAGDSKVVVLRPAGAGHTQSWTTNGSGTHFGCINQTNPDGDTTYLSSSTIGQIDVETLDALPASVTAVLAVQTVISARKDDASVRQIAPVLSDGSTDAAGTTVGLANNFAYYMQAYDQNPLTTSNWATGDFATLQAGAKVIA